MIFEFATQSLNNTPVIRAIDLNNSVAVAVSAVFKAR